MKSILLVMATLFIAIPVTIAQKQDPKSKQPTGLTNEQLSAYYNDLARKRTQTGGILALSGGIAAGIGVLLVRDGINSETDAWVSTGELIGAFLFVGGTACTVTGGFMIIYGSTLRRKARLALVNEPVQTFRLGAPARIPSIGIQITLGSK
jgi:hypothetical protein